MNINVAGTNLTTPPSLPQWLEELLKLLKKAMQRDHTGQFRQMWVLPARRVPSLAQKIEIETYCQTLASFDEMTPIEDQRFGSNTLAAVSRMILVLGGRRLGDLAGEAKGEAYMLALEDVPYWAVTIAERKWYRGEYGEAYDYSFPPSPAKFRELSRNEQFLFRYRCTRLKRLLEAVEEDSR